VHLPRTTAAARGRTGLITVIQPYLPAYRVPFFDELGRLLAEADCRLRVVHGEPEGGQAERDDARVGSWSVPIPVRTLRLRGHDLHWRPVLRLARRSEVVVAELASTNLDTYLLALDPRVHLMLWGHGKSYVTEASALDRRLERWLARRARHVFVYTEGGAAFLRSQGYRADRLTVVRNSTDTVGLRRAAAAIRDQDVVAFREKAGLGTGPVAAFIGSFDDSKRLPLLFEAATLAHDRLPGFRLVIAGAGPLQHLVDTAAASLPFVVALPRADVDTLALIGRTAECVVIPGRVGLVAVDALALGLPVVTTSFPHHAPEAEYLSDKVKVVADQTPESLAAALAALLNDPARLAAAKRDAYVLGSELGIEEMASAFATALTDNRRSQSS
jgi:glycosyltransferase involved in cell wall biosynthesis